MTAIEKIKSMLDIDDIDRLEYCDLTPLQISRIIEICEKWTNSYPIVLLIKNDDFKRAPFRSAITKSFTRFCLSYPDMHDLFFRVLKQRTYRPMELFSAISINKDSCFYGFSLSDVESMEKWVKNINCPLPICWNKQDTDPMMNIELAQRFVSVVIAVLNKPKPIHDRPLIIQDWATCIPKNWWKFIYERLPIKLQPLLTFENIKWLELIK